MMAVNLTAVYVLTQAVLPGMLERGNGTIVTVGSLAALKAGLIGGAVYGAAKAGGAQPHGPRAQHAAQPRHPRHDSSCRPRSTRRSSTSARCNPDAAARATMMQAEDVARAIMLCVTLPPRTVIEEIVMSPTILRDQSQDLTVAAKAGARPSGAV